VTLGVLDRVTAGGAAPDDLETFRAAYDLIRARYVDAEQAESATLVRDAIEGMVNGLGDTGHSRYLTAEQRQREQQQLSGRFVGVGVELAERDGRTVIVAAIPGSPAAEAKLRAGDRFLTIEGEDVSTLPLAEFRSRIRGPKGSSFRATILQADGVTRALTLAREEIRTPFVSWAPVEGSGIWHIRISQFGRDTAEELGRALKPAEAQGATGIVLDLRDNPGGLLDEAVGVVSRFVPAGVVLVERGRDGTTEPTSVKKGTSATTLPVVVLINGGSASSSEVVTAALLYHERAVAIGATTFGTATVLRPFELPDGSVLLLGVEEWLTPAGEPLRRQGVTPTEAVSLEREARPLLPRRPDSPAEQPCASDDAQLRAAVARLGSACPAA